MAAYNPTVPLTEIHILQHNPPLHRHTIRSTGTPLISSISKLSRSHVPEMSQYSSVLDRNSPKLAVHKELNGLLLPGDTNRLLPPRSSGQETKRKHFLAEYRNIYFDRHNRFPTPELCVYEIQKKERDLDRERDWAAIDRQINVQAFDHGTVDKGLNNEVVKYNILNALHITNDWYTTKLGSKLDSARNTFLHIYGMYGNPNESNVNLANRLAKLAVRFIERKVAPPAVANVDIDDLPEPANATTEERDKRLELFLATLGPLINRTIVFTATPIDANRV